MKPPCDCLDYRVWGHVCNQQGPPPGMEPNDWRALDSLYDPSPRPEPEPGDGFFRAVRARWLNRSAP